MVDPFYFVGRPRPHTPEEIDLQCRMHFAIVRGDIDRFLIRTGYYRAAPPAHGKDHRCSYCDGAATHHRGKLRLCDRHYDIHRKRRVRSAWEKRGRHTCAGCGGECDIRHPRCNHCAQLYRRRKESGAVKSYPPNYENPSYSRNSN